MKPLLALPSLPSTTSTVTYSGSVLLGLGSVVLPFARVPQQQGDADGRESHDSKGRPVQLFWGGKEREKDENLEGNTASQGKVTVASILSTDSQMPPGGTACQQQQVLKYRRRMAILQMGHISDAEHQLYM